MKNTKVTGGEIIALLLAVAVVVVLTVVWHSRASREIPDLSNEDVTTTPPTQYSTDDFLCSTPYSRPAGETPEQSLRTFFLLLSQKDYCKAVSYYSGSYETFTNWNPDVSPNDFGRLWQRACEGNGLNCLPVKDIVEENKISNGAEFVIRYQNRDGSVFKRGPCCGATEGPVISTWPVLVREGYVDGEHQAYLIEVYPPYTP